MTSIFFLISNYFQDLISFFVCFHYSYLTLTYSNIVIKLFLVISEILFNIFINFNILNFLNYKLFLIIYLNILSIIIPLIISIAYITLIERKIIGAMQLRIGPNFIGIFGLLQPIADGIKLFFKETILPTHSDKTLFLFSPFFVFLLSLLLWFIVPLNYGVVFSDITLVCYFFLRYRL